MMVYFGTSPSVQKQFYWSLALQTLQTNHNYIFHLGKLCKKSGTTAWLHLTCTDLPVWCIGYIHLWFGSTDKLVF
jgi:hypothetical protein